MTRFQFPLSERVLCTVGIAIVSATSLDANLVRDLAVVAVVAYPLSLIWFPHRWLEVKLEVF